MRTRLVLLAATFLAGGLGMAVARTPPPAPQAPPPPPEAWGQPAADITGTVRLFKLTPIGELEAFILNDGTEVHLPPHLTQQLAASIRPGDRVEVRGWRSAAPGFIVGASVTDMRSGQTIVAQGYLLGNAVGRVMDVQEIGPSPDRLAQVGPAAPPGPGMRTPPPDLAPPPPPNPAYAPPPPR